MKLYYLTRSFYPYQKSGGSLLRKGQVDVFKKLNYNITVIVPNYDSNDLKKEDNIILIPQSYNMKLSLYLERLGYYEDYLDKWVKVAFEYLKDTVKKDDIVFTTSGGELGIIKLGSLLKKKTNCKFIVNFHDPLDYSIVNGLKLDKKFHVGREKQEERYLIHSDFILTSSKANQLSLQKKYPNLKEKIVNNYFGYIEKIDLEKYSKERSIKLRIAYVGNMGSLQKPEILYEIYNRLKSSNIEIYFIGNINSNKTLLKIRELNDKNIKFIEFLPHNEFLEFMSQNIDIGFVSLTSDYLGACVPSKIYEYINLELPMIGALPDGDGKDIINSKGYGKACKYNDIEGLSKEIESFLDPNYLKTIKSNIIRDKESWSMQNRIKEVDNYLRSINAN